jgi:hypothetical protein
LVWVLCNLLLCQSGLLVRFGGINYFLNHSRGLSWLGIIHLLRLHYFYCLLSTPQSKWRPGWFGVFCNLLLCQSGLLIWSGVINFYLNQCRVQGGFGIIHLHRLLHIGVGGESLPTSSFSDIIWESSATLFFLSQINVSCWVTKYACCDGFWTIESSTVGPSPSSRLSQELLGSHPVPSPPPH